MLYGSYSARRVDAWFAKLMTPGRDAHGKPKKIPNPQQLAVLKDVADRVRVEADEE